MQSGVVAGAVPARKPALGFVGDGVFRGVLRPDLLDCRVERRVALADELADEVLVDCVGLDGGGVVVVEVPQDFFDVERRAAEGALRHGEVPEFVRGGWGNERRD